MAQPIEAILGADAQCLREDFNAIIMDENANYGDVEDLLLSYGLEMDYVDQLMF